MSKRLKNYPDPVEVVHKYGADALRLYLVNSPVVRAEPLRFKGEGGEGRGEGRVSAVVQCVPVSYSECAAAAGGVCDWVGGKNVSGTVHFCLHLIRVLFARVSPPLGNYIG